MFFNFIDYQSEQVAENSLFVSVDLGQVANLAEHMRR